jgi:hypothetical protein
VEMFRAEKIIDQYERYYEQVLSGKPVPAF